MPLRDVTHVVFDRGTGPFNEAAALEAYHLVAKMDEEDAAEFVFHVVNEVVENTITENRDLIQKHLDRTVAKALVYADLDAVAEGLNAEERAEVKKQLLEAVSKADGFDPNLHPRGEGGRFRVDPNRKVTREEADEKRANGLGDIPRHPDMAKDSENRMTREEAERFRGQYEQIAAHLGQALNGEKNVILHYADGSQKQVNAASASKLAEHINPHQTKNVVGVSVEDYKPTIGNRIADLTGTLASPAGRGFNELSTGDQANVGSGASELTRQWYTAHPTNSSQQMFNRIGAGSQVLGAMAGGSPKLQAAAKFGSLVGQHGPQAEQVFGPPARRMAYRYRGTERTPDETLVENYGAAVHAARGANRNPGAPTWAERQSGRNQIIGWLQGRGPTATLTDLQLAAGHTPPSEGVLLNADGQIVTTAVGAADDWYLPFNLRHLKSLKGGEYIRTRSTGGLTTEDIYTGLMAGARRVTVVSRSGVYSMEFDPELRGGRRNNDKALRMTQRYGELLDAVQSGKVERQKLSRAAMSEIRGEVLSMYPEGSITPSQRQQATEALMEDRKANPWKIQAQIDALDDEQVARESQRQLTREEKMDFTERRVGLHEQKDFFYKLNGLGYRDALDALKEQFPYYVAQANFHPLTGLGSRDKGYIEPGALRPTEARANLFGGAQGSGKAPLAFQSARTADRAKPLVDRYGNDDGGGTAGAGDREPEPDKPSGGGGRAMPLPTPEEATRAAAAFNAHQKAAQAAVAVQQGLSGWVKGGFETDPEFAKVVAHQNNPNFAADMMASPEAPKAFLADVDEALRASNNVDKTHMIPGYQGLREAVPDEAGAYSPAAAMAAPEKIYSFPDLEAKRVTAGRQPLILSRGLLNDAGNEELLREAKVRAMAQAVKASIPEESGMRGSVMKSRLAEEKIQLRTDVGDKMLEGWLKDDGNLDASMEGVQVMRAAQAEGMKLPALNAAAAPAQAGPFATPVRKHPSGRDFTDQELAAGKYMGDNGHWQEI